jgi:hypothetical protein
MGAHGGRWWHAAGVLAVLGVQVTAPSSSVAQPGLRVEPREVEIGAFYAAQPVKVSAEIPEGCGAVIEIMGKDIEEQLLRKGRHWDIWMNVGEIDIDGAPTVYFAQSSDLSSLSPPTAETDFGYGALEPRVSFHGDVSGLSHLRIFDEFIKLKESEKLYRVEPGAVRLNRGADGASVVSGTFTIPSRIPPGTYRVILSVLRAGQRVETRTGFVEVRMVGLPALLKDLARHRGALYGLLAIVVAVAFGYLTGVAFKKMPTDSKDPDLNDIADK